MKRTSLFDVHVAAGAKMVEFAGFEMPVQYSGALAEHMAVREHAGEIAGCKEVIISATGYTGSGGFELYLPAEMASDVWKAIIREGEDFGLIPCGLASRDTLRLEKGYCLYGNDLNDETTPLEAGLGWITKLNTDFIGADVLRREKEEGSARKLIALKMLDPGVPRAGYLVCDDSEKEIGQVTSGGMSPLLKKGIALAYVKS
ncbi:unnamed protein product, partial [Cyprideis torosa]